MTDGDLAAFETAWGRFASWLSLHSPIDHLALRPPATADQVAELETRLGFPLHPQLRAMLERHNGVIERPERDNFHAGAFLPLGHRLNGTERILRAHEWLAHNRDVFAEGRGEDELNGHPHQWVPFAHPHDGGMAFVDHRPGPTHGHVYEMGIGSGIMDATEWAASLAGLFDGLATSLETGEPFRGSWPHSWDLPSGHSCLGWGSDVRAKMTGTPARPLPRRLDSPLPEPTPAVRGRVGRGLGPLVPAPAPAPSPTLAGPTPVFRSDRSDIVIDSKDPDGANH